MNPWERTQKLIGVDALNTLKSAKVAVFGIGGVGGFVTEAFARCGIGKIDLIDHDTVSVTNINRQIIATHETIGQLKVDVMKKRILSINPQADVGTFAEFYLPDTSFDFSQYDYVVDSIDTVTAKIGIIMKCKEAGTPIISSMGTGNKINPSMFEITDIYKTRVCPLARVMRKELKKRGIKSLKVVYSPEEIVVTERIPASISFVPSVAGLLIAGEVVRDICKIDS
ncbi:MAG: tRNA threonylcarbamoyladenosine dehydratase [Spirochaetales bacterium]|nr:tRNA threonylcarbamoyladenosine dehydratase [Spirochaetales bacterium]